MSAREDAPPLVAWYGDDFTGSAAVLEILEFAGVPSVLFTGIPSPAMRRRFADARAIGIAGVARSQTPEWMAEHLPPVFGMLADTGADIVHYKICSTFDSSPDIGSIGGVAELAAPIVGGAWHPLLVAAPDIGRYQTWGNLFAVADGTVFRLDRHPTMSTHPVTPMTEADVRLHLARQTGLPIGLVPLDALGTREAAERGLAAALAGGARIVAFDAVGGGDMAEIGRMIWENRREARFAIGSQGVEYALVRHWRDAGMIPPEAAPPSAGRQDVIAAVSGSVSPITAGQLAWADANGFEPIGFDAACVVGAGSMAKEIERTTGLALEAIARGASPIVCTARGPDDPAVAAFRAAVAGAGLSAVEANGRIGAALGEILARIRARSEVARLAVSGGDTSGHALERLGVTALTALAPVTPGTGICRAFAGTDGQDEFELALKGGQMGTPDYFGRIRDGGCATNNGSTSE